MYKHLILFVIIVFLTGATEAQACRCLKPSLEEAIDNATVIIHGKVVNSNRQALNTRNRLEIIQQWKGDTIQTLTIRGGTNCDFHFKEEEEYVVFAEGDPAYGYLKASVCNYSAPIAKIEDEVWEALKLLEPEPVPEPGGE